MSQLYMLDTNIVSDLVRDPRGPATANIARVSSEVVCVSIITAAELRYGCVRRGSAMLTAHVEAILGSIQIMAFDLPADLAYCEIRASLEAAGRPIGSNDLLIGTHAKSLGEVLVTANIGAFTRIEGLQVENWLVMA